MELSYGDIEMPETDSVKTEKPNAPKRDLTKEAKLRGWKAARYLYDSLPPNLLGDKDHPKDMTYKQFKAVYESIEQSMKDAFLRNQIIFFGKLGRFRVQIRKARLGINPATAKKGKKAEKIQLPERKTLKFVVNGKFKAELNKK